MAVVERIGRVRFDGALGAFREWTATAVTRDTTAGGSVDVTVASTSGGVAPAAADEIRLGFYTDTGTLVREVVLTGAPPLPNTQTFHFTATGLSGGAARAGTVEIRLRVINTTGGPAGTYDAESDGEPNTPPTTFTSTFDRGWIRGATGATVTISNLAAGGGKSSPFAFGDPLFHRTVLGAAPFITRTFTHTFGPLSETTASAATTLDKTFTGIVDKRFNALSESRAASVTVQNAALTGQPDLALTVTGDSATVDPRVTCEHLMQMDNASFATPPLSLNDADDQRLSTELGYIATNLRQARGTVVGNTVSGGVNGILFHTDLRSNVDAGIFAFGDTTTAARGGEAGWGGSFLTWSSSLPGGTWTKTVTITDAGQQATLTTAYLLGATQDYVLVAVDPRVGIHAIVTDAGAPAEHLQAGGDFLVIAWIMNNAIGLKEAPDAGSMEVAIVRYNPVSGSQERLASDTDPAGTAWVTWQPTEALNYFPMTVTVNDLHVFTKTFTATDGWGTINIRFLLRATISGTPYEGVASMELTGKVNQHGRYELDPVAFALGGGLVSYK